MIWYKCDNYEDELAESILNFKLTRNVMNGKITFLEHFWQLRYSPAML